MNQLKFCGCCQTWKATDLFAKNSAKKDGLQERCKSCRSKHHQKVKHLRKKPTASQKRRYLITSYGISIEQYEKLLFRQKNRCAICYSENWGKPSPSIDHCHTTGRIRGLLCNNCNRALGLLKDNERTLKNAAKYLKRSRPSE